jgi:hypothetical protein
MATDEETAKRFGDLEARVTHLENELNEIKATPAFQFFSLLRLAMEQIRGSVSTVTAPVAQRIPTPKMPRTGAAQGAGPSQPPS